MREPALVAFLDIHPFLSNPVIARAMKEVAQRCESKGCSWCSSATTSSCPRSWRR